MLKTLLAGALMSVAVAGSAQAAVIFVGSYQVDDGPNWTTNPTVYSAAEAAALIFGGVASDYDISTAGSGVADINHLGWYTTWGVSGGQQYDEDFKLDEGAPGYNTPGGNGTAISAYTQDNATGPQYTNYVFRVNDIGGGVPEPAAWALMITGFGLAGATMRRRRAAA